MIKTAITHALIAVMVQLLLTVYLVFTHQFSIDHAMLAGGIAACSGFLFREIAQHEYKGGGPKNVSVFYGLFNHWTLDSVLDIILPIIFTGGTWLLFISV